MATLAEIRAKLAAQQQKQETGTRDNSIYPFWNIPDNTTATLRFLPDGNPTNTFFWVERQIIKIPFEGVDNDTSKKVTVQVPCIDMYNTGKRCPVMLEIGPWFKDPSLENISRTYWKKRSYIFQGFVVEDPLNETDKPANPIRRFVINSSILGIIEASLMDPDMEDNPVDYFQGRDFRLSKTRKGQYANYSNSKWAMKTRSLTDEEASAVEEHGLSDLSDFLPKMPSEEELEAIVEMFQASVDGQPYDSEKWAKYYKPNTFGISSNDSSTLSTPTPKTTKVVKPVRAEVEKEIEEVEDVVSEDIAEEVDETTPAPTTSASDALAKLKARTTKSEPAEEKAAKPAATKSDPAAILEALRNRSKK